MLALLFAVLVAAQATPKPAILSPGAVTLDGLNMRHCFLLEHRALLASQQSLTDTVSAADEDAKGEDYADAEKNAIADLLLMSRLETEADECMGIQ